MATDSIIDVENLAMMLEKKLDQKAQQAAEVIIAGSSSFSVDFIKKGQQ